MISHRQSPEPAVAATAPATMTRSSGQLLTVPDDDPTSPAAECVGPVTLSPAVTRALRALVEAVGANDFLPLWICADVLATRSARSGAPSRARVIQGKREVVVSGGVVDCAASFRRALSHAARSSLTAGGDPAGAPVDVIIVVSQDGSRVYAECGAGVEPPVAHWWACAFVQQLSSMALAPDAPLADRPVADGPDRTR